MTTVYRPDHSPFAGPLQPPVADVVDLLALNAWGQPLQYLCWADAIGLFDVLERRGRASLRELSADLGVTLRGAEAFVGVLLAMQLLDQADGRFGLREVAREYLVRSSPYYVGFSLCRGTSRRIPFRLRAPQTRLGRWAHRPLAQALLDALRMLTHPMAFGRLTRLREQHSRNLAAGVAAAQDPHFDTPRTLVEIGGGSGTFAIPLAQRRPNIAITLIELPRSAAHVRRFLQVQGVAQQVKVLGLDVFAHAESIPPCDALYMGNFIHGFGDDQCLALLRGCHRALPAGGGLWICERLWNDAKDGPLLTALWHFIMMSHSEAGKQRTAAELDELLRATGFSPGKRVSLTQGFTLLQGVRI